MSCDHIAQNLLHKFCRPITVDWGQDDWIFSYDLELKVLDFTINAFICIGCIYFQQKRSHRYIFFYCYSVWLLITHGCVIISIQNNHSDIQNSRFGGAAAIYCS
uniref:Uncharacterized protein n=1 Tax=Scleropages formosus TaxID=113540 RepID=A0A8C9W5D7_SCLFO